MMDITNFITIAVKVLDVIFSENMGQLQRDQLASQMKMMQHQWELQKDEHKHQIALALREIQAKNWLLAMTPEDIADMIEKNSLPLLLILPKADGFEPKYKDELDGVWNELGNCLMSIFPRISETPVVEVAYKKGVPVTPRTDLTSLNHWLKKIPTLYMAATADKKDVLGITYAYWCQGAPSIANIEIDLQRCEVSSLLSVLKILCTGIVDSYFLVRSGNEPRLPGVMEKVNPDQLPTISERWGDGELHPVSGREWFDKNKSICEKLRGLYDEISRIGASRLESLPGGVEMEFVFCPKGTFKMGDERNRSVRLTRGFWIGKYPVTQEQWKSVMESDPSSHQEYFAPVTNVSWDKCQNFVKKVNSQSNGFTVSLPTEAQWEYASRAGATEDAQDGEVEVAWHQWNSKNQIHPVGTLNPNSWGIYDMLGNVWEWCNDWYERHLKDEDCSDPKGPDSGPGHVTRGGSFRDDPGYCRSTYRPGDCYGDEGADNVGFRLVLEDIPQLVPPECVPRISNRE